MSKLLIVLVLLSAPAFAKPVRYWACTPQGKNTNDPSLLILKGENDSAVFWFNRDLVRDEGTLPAGKYDGSLEPSASGFSLFAELDVEKYFPNALPKAKSVISLVLNLKATVFLAEMYVLWERSNGETQGLIIGNYACRAK